MYYIGTKVLHFTGREFWKCTPRKFFTLLDVHNEFNTLDEDKDRKQKKTSGEPPKMTMEELMAMR